MQSKLPLKPTLNWITAFLLISLAAALAQAALTPYVNEDLFLSLAIGRLITLGQIAQPDHWSFTMPHKVWINQAWLSHLIFYKLYTVFGHIGPFLLKVILMAASVIFTISLSLRYVTKNWALLFCSLGVMAGAPFTAIRPENFGLFYLCAFLFYLFMRPLNSPLRIMGIAGCFLLWVNSHGSFMLGLAIQSLSFSTALIHAAFSRRSKVVGLDERPADTPDKERSLSDALTNSPAKVTTGRRDVLTELMITIAIISIAAFVNPYGPKNLFMPFKQVGSPEMTSFSSDWLSLLDWRSVTGYVFGPPSTWPYIIYLLILGSLALLAFITAAPRWKKIKMADPRTRDAALASLIAICLILLSLRFRRLILFAALPLSSIGAILAYHVFSAHRNQTLTKDYSVISAVILSAIIALGSSFLALRAIRVYLPNNPILSSRPAADELMSFNSFSKLMPQFLSVNGFVERVLPGWEISSYLMFREPDIKVFMDCRDQSFYAPNIITDYFKIIGVLDSNTEEALNLTNHYGVETIALTADPIDFKAAVRLLGTRKWLCVYSDATSFVLRKNPKMAAPETVQAQLKYPDWETAVISRAVGDYFFSGYVTSTAAAELKKVVLTNPKPDLYRLIRIGLGPPDQPLDEHAVRYCQSEVERLNREAAFKPAGYLDMMESMSAIYKMLAADAALKKNKKLAELLEKLTNSLELKIDGLRHIYSGHTLRLW